MAIYAFEELRPDLPGEGRFWIAPGAHVIGRVRIGVDVGIWFGAVVRGDNESIDIGEATNIQEGAMLHADPGFPLAIGAGCPVGHHAILHGCTVGANTLVGMGAIVLNGARIGGTASSARTRSSPKARSFRTTRSSLVRRPRQCECSTRRPSGSS